MVTQSLKPSDPRSMTAFEFERAERDAIENEPRLSEVPCALCGNSEERHDDAKCSFGHTPASPKGHVKR